MSEATRGYLAKYPAGIRAITVHQPWASLLAFGIKAIETRSWATDYRGPLAIHAGRAGDVGEDAYLLARFASYGAELGCIPEKLPLPRGCIVGIAELVDCQAMTSGPSRHENILGNFGFGRFGWRLRHAQPLPRPIACRGHQRLWQVDDGHVRAMWQQITCGGLLVD